MFYVLNTVGQRHFYPAIKLHLVEVQRRDLQNKRVRVTIMLLQSRTFYEKYFIYIQSPTRRQEYHIVYRLQVIRVIGTI